MRSHAFDIIFCSPTCDMGWDAMGHHRTRSDEMRRDKMMGWSGMRWGGVG